MDRTTPPRDTASSSSRSRESSLVNSDTTLSRKKRDTRDELASLDRTEEFKLLQNVDDKDLKERRKVQNRYAQRRLRDHRKTKIEELEKILSEERKVLEDLKQENLRLKASMLQLQEMMRQYPMVPIVSAPLTAPVPYNLYKSDPMRLTIPPLPTQKDRDEPTPTTTESSQVVIQALLGMGRGTFNDGGPAPVM